MQASGIGHWGVADVNLQDAEPGLLQWLEAGFHGEMDYMARHGLKRARPAELLPGTLSVLMVAISYRPPEPEWLDRAWASLEQGDRATISLYARGRDYHKVLRKRLKALGVALAAALPGLRFRAFCDSAPVMEVALANRAKLGWRGKNTLLLNRQSGSMFFLGSLFINMPLERLPQALLSGPGSGDTEHCGSCRACLDVCPTQALVAPFQLDARRCISYLTIEHSGPIPEGLRSAIGNRIYGCDDCQLICPWNKFAVAMPIKDFAQRPELENLSLIEALTWSEDEFSRRTEGSAIRRIGHRRWQRNVVVALGNFLAGRVTHHAGTPKPTSGANLQALKAQRREARQALARARLEANTMLAEHIDWALSCSST